MAILNINNVDVKDPKVLQVEIQDIDKESERNANGTMQRTRVATKRKITVEWGPLSSAESSKILKSMSDVFFTVKYEDPMEGKVITKTFYVGDRTAPVLKVSNGVTRWEGLKTSLVEN